MKAKFREFKVGNKTYREYEKCKYCGKPTKVFKEAYITRFAVGGYSKTKGCPNCIKRLHKDRKAFKNVAAKFAPLTYKGLPII